MSLKDVYDNWSGKGGHQASGNAKTVGQAGVDFFDNTFAKGFSVKRQQGETDFDLSKVENGDVPSTRLSPRNFTEARTYSDSIVKE